MSVWKSMAEKATQKIEKKVQRRTVFEIVSSVTDYIDGQHSAEALLKSEEYYYKMIINGKGGEPEKKFIVYDEFKNKKYRIKIKKHMFGKPEIILMDMDKAEIGRVCLETKHSYPIRYRFYLDGQLLGNAVINNTVKFNLDLDFNNWHVDGTLFGFQYTVTNSNGGTVLKIHKATNKDYTIEYENKSEEIIALLIFMTIKMGYSS